MDKPTLSMGRRMTSIFGDTLKLADPEGYRIGQELLSRYPNLTKKDFDTGVPTIDVSKSPHKITDPGPNSKVSSREIRRLALKIATEEYRKWVEVIRGGGKDKRKSGDLLASALRRHGMFIPWFFYSEDNVRLVLSKFRSAERRWKSTGDLEKSARMMHGLIKYDTGLGISYTTDLKLEGIGVDGLLKRRTARCEELAFLAKGIALVLGIPEPSVHDTLHSDSDLDHIYTSFQLPRGMRLFLDPLLKKPIAATKHPKLDAMITDGLHLMSIFEMNATSRNCSTTKCSFDRAKRAVIYSPIYRNHYLLGNSYLMVGALREAKDHHDMVCQLNPAYFLCN